MLRRVVALLGSSIFALSAAEIIVPIPEQLPVNPEMVALGEQLFFDPSLSQDGTIACATCHRLEHGGAEPTRVSTGIKGQQGTLNAPTVLNAVFNIAQFWDGRAVDLVEQAKGPIANPIEMGHTLDGVVAFLRSDDTYRKRFTQLFPQKGITPDTIAQAIAEYEKTLITPHSPFDRYLNGDKGAISSEAKRGFELFKSKGCVACHHGVNVGGNQYQRFGAVIPNREIGESFLGRYLQTKDEEDRYYVKVPSLRNVARTSPYFHTGEVPRLEEAVRMMGYHQLGIELTPEEIGAIVAFLQSLNGELHAAD